MQIYQAALTFHIQQFCLCFFLAIWICGERHISSLEIRKLSEISLSALLSRL